MESENSLWGSALPAIMALAGVFLTLLVQGINERSRRKHESKLVSRAPLTIACEDLLELLEEQMSAITDIESLANSGMIPPIDHPSIPILVEKGYRKKLWVIIEDQSCFHPINKYADLVEGIVFKLVARNEDQNIPKEIEDAVNHLGVAIKNITKHTAGIWGVSKINGKVNGVIYGHAPIINNRNHL